MSVPPFVGLPAGVRPGFLPTSGGPLAVLTAGPPQPTRCPVLLVPGFTGSKEDFLGLLNPIAAAGHPVLTYDQRGQYQSVGPDDSEAYTVSALAGDVRQLVDHLGGGPVHLLGHSFGGLVARRAVLDDPSRYRSLVLLGSGPSGIPGQRAVWLRRLRRVLDYGGVPAVWEATKALSAGNPASAALSPQMQEFLRTRFLASNDVGMGVMGAALLHEPDTVDQLRDTEVPVLVAHGEDDDAWPAAVQAEMAERLAARYVAVPGAGHSPAAEAAEATVATLLEFWADVEVPAGQRS